MTMWNIIPYSMGTVKYLSKLNRTFIIRKNRQVNYGHGYGRCLSRYHFVFYLFTTHDDLVDCHQFSVPHAETRKGHFLRLGILVYVVVH